MSDHDELRDNICDRFVEHLSKKHYYKSLIQKKKFKSMIIKLKSIKLFKFEDFEEAANYFNNCKVPTTNGDNLWTSTAVKKLKFDIMKKDAYSFRQLDKQKWCERHWMNYGSTLEEVKKIIEFRFFPSKNKFTITFAGQQPKEYRF